MLQYLPSCCAPLTYVVTCGISCAAQTCDLIASAPDMVDANVVMKVYTALKFVLRVRFLKLDERVVYHDVKEDLLSKLVLSFEMREV